MYKTIQSIVKILFFIFTLVVGNSFAGAGSIYTQEKLHTGWFNPLGGLDNIMTRYAVLTIDDSGGISIKDNFNVFADYIGQHWVTIDSVYRDKNRKDSVSIYATFHHMNTSNGQEYKYQGNGSFKFPPSGTIHIVQGGAPSVEIVDQYAQTHHTYQNTNNNQGEQNEHQNNDHDPCDISSRIRREQVSNRTFIEFKKGRVMLKPVGCDKWIKAKINMDLKLGDEIKTGPNGRVTIVLGGTSFIKVKPNSKVIIPKSENTVKKVSFIELAIGVLFARARKERNSLKVAVPNAICGVRGTEFEVSYINDVSCVKALKHSVWFSDLNKRKTVIVHEGEKSCIGVDTLPLEPTPIFQEPHNGSGVFTSPSNTAQTPSSTGVKQYHFTGYDSKGYVVPSLLLKIYPSGKIDGLYTAKGRTLPNNNCAVSSRVPFHGNLTGSIKPAVRGMMDVGVQWCERKANIPPHTKAAPFDLWYDKKQGLVMEIENGYGGYRLFFNNPPINPFSELETTVPQSVPAISIAGTWKTNFGEMNLVQKGNTVTGNYTHDQGQLTGKIEGNVLAGKWSEKPTYKPLHDAGDFRFVFSKDGKSFSGKWRYGYGGNGWKGNWTGHRILPKEEQ